MSDHQDEAVIFTGRQVTVGAGGALTVLPADGVGVTRKGATALLGYNDRVRAAGALLEGLAGAPRLLHGPLPDVVRVSAPGGAPSWVRRVDALRAGEETVYADTPPMELLARAAAFLALAEHLMAEPTRRHREDDLQNVIAAFGADPEDPLVRGRAAAVLDLMAPAHVAPSHPAGGS